MSTNPSERAQPERRLRIAMVVPPWYELPPPGYGGLEQVCSALVDGLAAKGHEVTLFGAGTGTGTAAHFVGTVPELQHHRLGQTLPELAHLTRVNRMISPDSFDIVHDHTTVGPYATDRAVPTIATVHGKPTGELREVLADVDPKVGLVAISHTQRRLAPELPWVATVHNGISTGNLVTKSAPGMGPVLWLARFSADKGPDLAIEACRAAGLPLVLAGKCDERSERRYLEQVVEPMLGPDVTVLRNPDRDATVRLLLAARCLIMPIRWEEPFGMVMVEAMATGTPVVALNRGAVPELIRSGETGLICDDPSELGPALREVSGLDPGVCAAHVRREFSAERMAEDYERVYRAFVEPGLEPPVRPASAPTVAW
ncbi:glycosyltransferase family 4 protein [Plantactinospora sp. CA-294935]|uniref:glycosyltransferase family 4 protein n=1 Tax=Plantactinospora sp. CA-294935 TaxID=3240012 RepID=UPI003D8C0C67